MLMMFSFLFFFINDHDRLFQDACDHLNNNNIRRKKKMMVNVTVVPQAFPN